MTTALIALCLFTLGVIGGASIVLISAAYPSHEEEDF
jgi:hypothetical protein